MTNIDELEKAKKLLIELKNAANLPLLSNQDEEAEMHKVKKPKLNFVKSNSLLFSIKNKEKKITNNQYQILCPMIYS